jgi:PKD repeat protein
LLQGHRLVTTTVVSNLKLSIFGLSNVPFLLKVIASNSFLISVEATVNQIKIYKPPVASFTTDPTLNGCVNTNVCVTNTSTPGYGLNCNQVTTWLWNFGDPGGANNTSTLQTPPCHTYSTPGTYTITLTASNDQCQSGSVISHIVTINPSPTLFTVTGGGEYCSGGAGVFVGLSDSEPGVNYRLFINGVTIGGIVAGTGLPIIFGNQSSPGIYTVHATNQVTSCSNTMTGSVAIFINPLPTANAGADQIIPYGTSAILAGSAGAGTAPLSYLWTPAGSIVSGGTTLNPQTTNLYSSTTFTLLVTDSKGCTASDNVIVSSGGNPLSVTCNATPGTICNNGASVQLYAVAAGGSGTYAYSWVSNPVGSPVWTSTLPNPVVNPTVTTTYTVTVNDGYNTASTQVIVTVNPSPLVYVVTGGGEFCSGGSGIPIGLSGAQMGVSYQLLMNGMPVGPSLVGTGGPIIFGIFTTGGTYTAVATNIATSCSSMMAGNAIIVVNPLPQVTNSPLSKTICSGTSTSISLFSTVPGTTYQWTSSVISGSVTGNSASGIGTGFIGDILVNTGMVTASVNYLITPVANGCFGPSVNYIVAVQPLPLIGTSPGSQTICSGTSSQPITISSSLAGTTYSWSTISTPGISGAQLNGTSNPVPGWVLNNSAATAGTVAVNIVPTFQGCTGPSLNYLINVNPRPVPSIAGPVNVCVGSSGQMYSTESGMSGYTWSVSPGGTITSGSGTNQVAITWQSAGSQTVNVSYANSSGCSPINPSTYPVTVNGIPAAAGAISGLPAVCVNASGVPYSIAPLQNALTYNWTLPLGASMASGSGTNSITVNFPNYVTTGNIRVAGVNNCFTGTSSPNLQVKTNAQLTGQVNLSNMTIGNGQEECLAVQSIILGGEAPFTVQSGGLVRLIAGNNIVFLTGTSINPGGYLSALITQQCIPCNTLKSNDLTRVTAESDGRNETLSTPQDNPYFMIYPNPTDGKFTIASKNRDMDHTVVLQIFDVMGKMKVEERLEPFSKREFSISEFPAGIYQLRLIVDDNTQVIRMIKAK